MENNNSGETSKKKSDSDSDRPLKKARYLWQVKGKYHLKDNSPEKETVSNSTEIHNNNIQTRNKNVCNDRSCIEALIANSDKIMVMDFPEPESPPKTIDKSHSDEIPITLVKPSPKNEDYYLRKWQARQIAKGFVDNTINRVLESWMVAPFDAADFVENCDNGGQIEDEGILMAIQSHGLQGNNILLQNGSCRTTNSSCTCAKTRTETNTMSITPFHRREETDFSIEYYENLCVLKDKNYNSSHSSAKLLDKPSEASGNPSKLSESSGKLSESYGNLSKLSDSSGKLSESYDNLSKLSESSGKLSESSANLSESSGKLLESSDILTYDSLKMNDTDFLDAAVAAAIQKKGLASYSCVDCG